MNHWPGLTLLCVNREEKTAFQIVHYTEHISLICKSLEYLQYENVKNSIKRLDKTKIHVIFVLL